MKTLNEIATQQGTDKADPYPGKPGHGYTRYYDWLFNPFRNEPIRMMEIGVGGGESIKTWLEYFPNARIYGVDKVHGTNEWNTVGSSPDKRYTFVTGDQTDETFWKCFAVDYGDNWSIIMDDGGHCNDQIITSFRGLWPILKSGGLYCIEDLGVSYGAGSVFVKDGWQNHMDFVKDKLDDINRHDEIEWLHFSKELCVLKKK